MAKQVPIGSKQEALFVTAWFGWLIAIFLIFRTFI